MQPTESNVSTRKELIAFRTAGQDFCVDIQSVREIRMWSAATRLPFTPDYVVGVINLRGTVVPIFDLSARLSLGDTSVSDRNVVIIAGLGERKIGILVEAVFDIISVPQNDIQDVPSVSADPRQDAVTGLISVEERTIRLIDVGRIVSLEQEQLVRAAT